MCRNPACAAVPEGAGIRHPGKLFSQVCRILSEYAAESRCPKSRKKVKWRRMLVGASDVREDQKNFLRMGIDKNARIVYDGLETNKCSGNERKLQWQQKRMRNVPKK